MFRTYLFCSIAFSICLNKGFRSLERESTNAMHVWKYYLLIRIIILYRFHWKDHWKKKLSHFDLKSWVIGGTKIRPGIPSNWRIFAQFDSKILPSLGILCRILVLPLPQLFRSKWLNFFFQWSSFGSLEYMFFHFLLFDTKQRREMERDNQWCAIKLVPWDPLLSHYSSLWPALTIAGPPRRSSSVIIEN